MQKLTFFLISILFFVSCGTHKTMIDKEYIHDTLQVVRIDSVVKHQFDSIYVHDSVYTTKYLRGDSVFTETIKYKYIDRWHDTGELNKQQKDSVKTVIQYKDRNIEKTVVKYKIPWYVKVYVYIGIITLLLYILSVLRKYKVI